MKKFLRIAIAILFFGAMVYFLLSPKYDLVTQGIAVTVCTLCMAAMAWWEDFDREMRTNNDLYERSE